MVNPMQFDFENKLTELGLSYSFHHDGFYIISQQKNDEKNIIVRLLHSLPISKQVNGSKNGNEVQAIGMFKFILSVSGPFHDILGFAFYNAVKNQPEFLILPTKELLIRQVKMHPGSVRRKSVEMVFWLMEDGCVYDTTNISPEGEWYILSKGVGVRMAAGSELDYSEYLNSWQWLIVQ